MTSLTEVSDAVLEAKKSIEEQEKNRKEFYEATTSKASLKRGRK